MIKDKCVDKINDKKLYSVSRLKNGGEELTTYLFEDHGKLLYLHNGSKIELEVDVKGKISTKNLR